MGFFDQMSEELLENQEQMQASLNIKEKKLKKQPAKKKAVKKEKPKRKVDLHVTIPEELKKKLEQKALKEHRSVAVMLEIILEKGLNKS